MRNNIISLKEYFYFTYPLVIIWANRKNYCTQILAYRSEKYFCKGMILFHIYLGIYFLADKVECHKTKFCSLPCTNCTMQSSQGFHNEHIIRRCRFFFLCTAINDVSFNICFFRKWWTNNITNIFSGMETLLQLEIIQLIEVKLMTSGLLGRMLW